MADTSSDPGEADDLIGIHDLPHDCLGIVCAHLDSRSLFNFFLASKRTRRLVAQHVHRLRVTLPLSEPGPEGSESPAWKLCSHAADAGNIFTSEVADVWAGRGSSTRLTICAADGDMGGSSSSNMAHGAAVSEAEPAQGPVMQRQTWHDARLAAFLGGTAPGGWAQTVSQLVLKDLHLASLAPLCAPPAWCTSLTRLQLHRPVLCGPVFDALAALSSLSCLVLLHPVVLNYPIYPNANILGDYTSPAATSYGTWLRQRLIAEGDAWNAKPYASISHLTQLRHLEFCEEEYRVDERCGWLQLVNFPAVLRALKGLVHLRLHTAYAPANIMVAGLSTLSALTHLSARLAWEGRDMMAAGSGDRAQAGGVPQAAAGGAVAPAAQPERRHVLDCLVAGCPGLVELDLLDLDIQAEQASALLHLTALTRLSLGSMALTGPLAAAQAELPNVDRGSSSSSSVGASGSSAAGAGTDSTQASSSSGGSTAVPVLGRALSSCSNPGHSCSWWRLHLWSLDGLSPLAAHLPWAALTHPLKVALLTLDLTPLSRAKHVSVGSTSGTPVSTTGGHPASKEHDADVASMLADDPVAGPLLAAARVLAAHYAQHAVSAPPAGQLMSQGHASVSAVTHPAAVRQSLLPAGLGDAGIHTGAIPKCRVELPPATQPRQVAGAALGMGLGASRHALLRSQPPPWRAAVCSTSSSTGNESTDPHADPSASSAHAAEDAPSSPSPDPHALTRPASDPGLPVLCAALETLSPLAPHIHRLEIREREKDRATRGGPPVAAVPMSPARLAAVARTLGPHAHHVDIVVHEGLLPCLTDPALFPSIRELSLQGDKLALGPASRWAALLPDVCAAHPHLCRVSLPLARAGAQLALGQARDALARAGHAHVQLSVR